MQVGIRPSHCDLQCIVKLAKRTVPLDRLVGDEKLSSTDMRLAYLCSTLWVFLCFHSIRGHRAFGSIEPHRAKLHPHSLVLTVSQRTNVMKFRTWMWTAVVCLLASPALTIGSAAQDNPTQNNQHRHHQYKLIDVGTSEVALATIPREAFPA